MKKSKSFRLDEDVVEILDSQDNATLFLEEAVRNYKKDPPWKNMEYTLQKVENILNVISIPKEKLKESANTQPQLPPCCSLPAPCKHWEWDGTDSVYIHKITGETKNADNY